VTVRAAGSGEDAHGNPVMTDVTYNEVPCFVTQRSTLENVAGQDLVVTQLVSAWAPGAPINAGARVSVDLGDGILHDFEVMGDPAVGTNARTGAVHHLEANLARSTG
jgi:hypothetical protein